VRSLLPSLVAQEKGGEKGFVFGGEVRERVGQLGQGTGGSRLLVCPIQGSSLL